MSTHLAFLFFAFCCAAITGIWFGYWIAVAAVTVLIGLGGFLIAAILVVAHDHRMI